MDITDPNGEKTCGWLISEVTRKYSISLVALQKREMQAYRFQKASDGFSGNGAASNKGDLRAPRQQRRYIVALKTQDGREGVDSWLN